MFRTRTHYSVYVICSNCEERNVIHVPVGTTVNAYLKANVAANKKTKCSHCECETELIRASRWHWSNHDGR